VISLWKSPNRLPTLGFTAAAVGALVLAWIATDARALAQGQRVAATSETKAMPRYDSKGALQLPDNYRQWVFVGSSLGLSYSEGAPGMEMFHETLMEPTAYKAFVETGTFREGAMLALILHGTGESVLPQRHGRFASEVHGVEMAVKDPSHRAEGWAYYNFGGVNGLRSTAEAMPKESCYSCHSEHAQRDNVFLQFYPMLAEAAHLTVATTPASPQASQTGRTAAASTPQTTAAVQPLLALKGLDPVLLVQGREEMGKPEIIATNGRYKYQFVSEPNRVKFAADPAAFSIQNDTCLVVPGARVDPSLFVVHDGKIYGFATDDCVAHFKSAPTDYLKH
jgi:YHS domain-containing protein